MGAVAHLDGLPLQSYVGSTLSDPDISGTKFSLRQLERRYLSARDEGRKSERNEGLTLVYYALGYDRLCRRSRTCHITIDKDPLIRLL